MSDRNWLTSTVYAICNGMRQTGDYSPLPILADALQDAECDDAEILNQCRDPNIRPLIAQRLVCLILGGEYAASASWLTNFCDTADCPDYEDTVSAAIGVNLDSDENDVNAYHHIENDGVSLHFGGRDAHGDIPAEFWDHVARVTGKDIPQNQRAPRFSCSC